MVQSSPPALVRMVKSHPQSAQLFSRVEAAYKGKLIVFGFFTATKSDDATLKRGNILTVLDFIDENIL